MEYRLEEIATYSNKKIERNKIDYDNYISTENMLPNRLGVIKATSLPNQSKVRFFEEDNILISNIRPYFKKIWFANCNGGCSNDVLNIKVIDKKIILPKYLYYILFQDDFFDYVMAGNKGTKMPRGDKKHIMQYIVNIPNIEIQTKIVTILEGIDKKVELNNQINDNLYNQAVAIYKNRFQRTRQGDCSIGDYIVPKRGKNLLSRDAILGNVPVVAGGIEPATYHNISNTKAPVITISASGANAGYINLWNIPVWSSDSSYIDNDITESVYFWYVTLKTRQKEIYDAQTGSAQPHIYPQHIAELPMNKLDVEDMLKYEKQVIPFFKMIGKNKEENKCLEQLRNTLLPKLMNGEIDLDKIEI